MLQKAINNSTNNEGRDHTWNHLRESSLSDTFHTELTRKLLAIDTESLLRWQAYDDERRRKRGAKELPAEPDVHFRLMETVFSNSSLLKRQSQGNGLHQLVFCTELDSLYKKRRQTIIDFRWAKAEEMPETKVAEFGEEVNKDIEETRTKRKGKMISLYEELPESFTLSELEQKAQVLDVRTPVKIIISIWTKSGIINKSSKTSYQKSKK